MVFVGRTDCPLMQPGFQKLCLLIQYKMSSIKQCRVLTYLLKQRSLRQNMTSIIIEKRQCINKLLFRSRHVPLQIKVRSFVTIAKRVTSRVGSVNVTVDPMKATPGTKWTQPSPKIGLFLRFGRNVSKHSLGAHKTSNQFHSYCSENRL